MVKQKKKQKSDTSQKVAVHALQKHVQLLKLREYLLLISFIFFGAFLRVPMQVVPSAEPISFFALLAGWLFGKKKGFVVGASSLYISNFLVMGGHGPWTIFQALGFGIIGFLGGFLNKKSRLLDVIVIALIGTTIYEIIMNFSSMMIFPFGFYVFVTALPFTIIHLISNLIFATILPRIKRLIEEKGGFNEKDIAVNLLNRFCSSSDSNWVQNKS